jgi:hypothetical protein
MKNMLHIACYGVFATAVLIYPAKVKAQSIIKTQSLFDGKTLKGWKQVVGNASYKVENGVIVGTTVAGSGNSFLVTEKEYGDFMLDLDVMIESKVSNSGIQTRSHFNTPGHANRVYGRQVEIDPSDRAWSGGIYDEGRREWLYPLDLHPEAKTAFKVGVYNHIKVMCKGNEMKTWVNNIPVAYVIDTVDSKGFIGLQVHAVSTKEQEGKRVYFKNIRLNTGAISAVPFPADIYVVNNQPNYLSWYEKQHGWKLLFDGRSSSGWRSAAAKTFPAKGWTVNNGTMTVESSEGKEAANGGDIVTTKEYSAFDLSFEFKLTPGANSGVKYFVTLDEKTKGSAIGLEYQVLDDELHPDAKLGRFGNRTLSSLYDLIPAQKQKRFIRPVGAWNQGRVVVTKDNHVTHYLNGVKVLEYVRKSQAFRDSVAISKFKVWPNFGEAKQGHILLQDHGNQVSYRSIKIKELK